MKKRFNLEYIKSVYLPHLFHKVKAKSIQSIISLVCRIGRNIHLVRFKYLIYANIDVVLIILEVRCEVHSTDIYYYSFYVQNIMECFCGISSFYIITFGKGTVMFGFNKYSLFL